MTRRLACARPPAMPPRRARQSEKNQSGEKARWHESQLTRAAVPGGTRTNASLPPDDLSAPVLERQPSARWFMNTRSASRDSTANLIRLG